MTTYDSEALRYRNLLRERAKREGWSEERIRIILHKYDLIQREFCQQVVAIELMKFQRRAA